MPADASAQHQPGAPHDAVTTGPAGRSLATLMHAIESVDLAERSAAAGERLKALELYGSALDDLLDAEAYTLAASTARQMLDRFPGVVRARGTLAVLSLAERLRSLSQAQLESSRHEFELYIIAARATGQEHAAICYLRSVLDAAESPAVREWLEVFLDEIEGGAAAGKAPRAHSAGGEEHRIARPGATRQDHRWSRILRKPARSSTAPAKAPGEEPGEPRGAGPEAALAAEREAARLGGLTRALSHSLRNELQTILTNVSLAQELGATEDCSTRYERIRSAVLRINALLENARDPGRSEPAA
jgi:hypothetical protein